MYVTYNSEGQYENIYNAEELSKLVSDTIEYYKTKADRYMIQNKKLTENAAEIVKKQYEEEINDLKEKLALSYGEFASQKEKDRYLQFEQKHMHNRAELKANGGRAPYLIPTGTGIGVILKVVCPICGESEDITDTEVW